MPSPATTRRVARAVGDAEAGLGAQRASATGRGLVTDQRGSPSGSSATTRRPRVATTKRALGENDASS